MQAYYYRYFSDTNSLEISLMRQGLIEQCLLVESNPFLSTLGANSSAKIEYDLPEFRKVIYNIISPLFKNNQLDFSLNECKSVRFFMNSKSQKIWVAEAYLNSVASVYFVQSEFERQINCRLDMEHYTKELVYWMGCPFDMTPGLRIEGLLKSFNVPYILNDEILVLFPCTKQESLYLRCPDRGCVYLYSSLTDLRQKGFLDPKTNNFYAFIDPFKFPSFDPVKGDNHHLPCMDDAMEMFDVFEINFLDSLANKT